MSLKEYAKVKFVGEYLRDETIHVGKGESDIVQLGLWTGFSIFGNGEEAIMSGVNFFDARGKGAWHGHGIAVFNDGSTFVERYSGGAIDTVPGTNRSTSAGTWKIASGTGRFAGVKGSWSGTVNLVGNRFTGDVKGELTKA
jgi:hypothetical protein